MKESNAGRATRLACVYRAVNRRAWLLWNRGQRAQAVLLDRTAREAAYVALLESCELSEAQIVEALK